MQDAADQIAEAVIWWRDRAELTREEVAVLTGRSHRTIVRWEHGLSQPGVIEVRLMEAHHHGLVRRLFPGLGRSR
jgi:DNA-binding transcriptional regulator YiaG